MECGIVVSNGVLNIMCLVWGFIVNSGDCIDSGCWHLVRDLKFQDP